MSASGGKRRRPATPSTRDLTALDSFRSEMEDDDDDDAEADAGEGGHHGAPSRKKVSRKGAIPCLQTGLRSGSAKKKNKDSNNNSDEDNRLLVPKLSQHRLSSSKAGEPEPCLHY